MEENSSDAALKTTPTIHGQLPPVARMFLSLAFLAGAVVYTISPIDMIPDFFGPFGWVDDISVWVLVVVADMKLLLRQGVDRGRELDAGIKSRDGFFSENVDDRRQR